MLTPQFVLKPTSPGGYKQVLLYPGTKFLGRSMETGIKNASVSRKHFEVSVDDVAGTFECKIRSVAKHELSILEVDGGAVTREWRKFPVRARLEIRTATKAMYPYTLERFVFELHGSDSQAGAVATSGTRNGSHSSSTRRGTAVDESEEDMIAGMQCAFCMGLFVDPTEVDCRGRHLFCLSCIKETLTTTTVCPVCRMAISETCRQRIMGSKRRSAAGTDTYQSQAISFIKDSIRRAIDRRLCDYSDECEWRRRSGLEPLPPPVDDEDPDAIREEGTGTGASTNGALLIAGNGGANRGGAGSRSGNSSSAELLWLGSGGGVSSGNKRAKLNPATPASSRASSVFEVIDVSDDD